jgi:single-stranded DNA-binding protein
MYEIPINAAGRLTADPQRTVRRDGVVVAKLDVEVSQRRQTPDGWRVCGLVRLECRAWGTLAEHALESLGCGDRVVVIGRLRQRPVGPGAWSYDVVVEDLGASLRFTNVWFMPSEPVAPGEPAGVIVDDRPRSSTDVSLTSQEA